MAPSTPTRMTGVLLCSQAYETIHHKRVRGWGGGEQGQGERARKERERDRGVGEGGEAETDFIFRLSFNIPTYIAMFSPLYDVLH